MLPATLTLDALRAVFLDRPVAVKDAVEEVLARVAAARDPAIFISLVAPDDLRRAASDLLARSPDPSLLPLWGNSYLLIYANKSGSYRLYGSDEIGLGNI